MNDSTLLNELEQKIVGLVNVLKAEREKNEKNTGSVIESQKLSAGHAKILVGLDNASFVANKIVENKLSVRQAENFVQLFKKKRHKSKIRKDTNIVALELSISNKIGLKTKISFNKEKI